MDHASSPQRPVGKLESLPKDELLKLIKKQAFASKDLKKKVADLEDALSREKEEVNQLEQEKKEWIGRGVSAEFEKKDKLVKKDRELELAARLAAEMLEENDGLRGQLQNQRKENEDILMQKVLIELVDDNDRLKLQLTEQATIQANQMTNKEDLINKLKQEKEAFTASLSHLQEEFETTVLESQELRDKLLTVEEERDTLKTACEENETLKERIKDLEYQLANPAKLNKLKEEFEGLGKENKALREAKMLAEQDRKVKSEQILNFDKDITNLRKELAEKNKIIKEKKIAMEAMRVHNDEVTANLNQSELRVKELEAEVQKAQVEKEKYLKAIKSMKTKFERSSLIEDELRKQLNTIVGERDELLKKNVKRTQKLKAKENNDTAKKGEIVEELKFQLASVEAENHELKEVIESHNKKTEEILTKYENIKRDFDNLNFELDELTAIRNEHIEEKEKLTAGNESLAAELQKVKEEFDTLEFEREALIKDNEVKVDEIKNLQIDVESLSEEMKELLAEQSSHKEEKESVFNDREELTNQLTKIKEECEQHIVENNKLNEEINYKKEELETNKTEHEDLKSQLEPLLEELDMFKKGATETKATILKLEGRVEELLYQLQAINEEKFNQENALEELFKSHDDLSNKYDFECQEREKKEREVSSLEEQLSLLQSKEGKEKSTTELEQQITHLEETINDISAKRDHYQKELLLKEQCLQQLRHDFEEFSKKSSSNNSNNNSNQDLDEYRYEIENIRTQLLSVTKELELSNEEKENIQTMAKEALSERDNCNKSLEVIKQQLAVLNSDFDIKAHECDELKQQLIEHSTPNNSLNGHQDETLLNLQRDLEYLEHQYKQASSENFTLKEECRSLTQTKSEYENDFEELKIKLDQYEKEKNTLSDKLVQYSDLCEKYGYDKIYDFDNYISSLSSDVDTSAKMLQNLTCEKEQVNAKYTEIETKLNCYYIDIEEKNENISKLENELLTLKRDHEMLVDRNNTLIKQNSNEVYETDDDMEQKDNEIRQLTCDIHKKHDEIYEKDNEINRMLIGIHEKENEINEKSKEIDHLQNEIHQKDNIIEHLTNDIRQHKESAELSAESGFDSEDLQKEVQLYKDELVNVKQALNDAHLEMVALRTSEENHSNEILEKHTLIGELKAELISLSESIQKEEENYVQSENSDENEQLFEKETHIKQLSEQLKEAEDSLQNLNSELELKEQSLLELMAKYEELYNENEKLQESHSKLERSFEEQNASVVDERDQAVEELNQLSTINVNIENKLQAAFDKVLALQNALEEKTIALNEMDALVKEKGDKGSKFKSVAIKAKKELEALRTKYQEETASLEQQLFTLREDATFLEKELVQQKTICSKHEEEFEEFQLEIKTLQTQLQSEQESVKAINGALSQKEEDIAQLNNTVKASEDSLKQKTEEMEKLKPAMTDVQKRLDSALTESTQMSNMKLEIADYERTMDGLQLKLQTKEKQGSESLETIKKMTEMQKNMEDELAKLKKESRDMENKNEKLKATIAKLKKDITDKERQQEENVANINGLEMIVESLKGNIEDLKVQVATLNSEKLNNTKEMKTSLGQREKLYQTLEVKFSRVSNDLMTSQKEKQALAQEYEQYKVRAHNVLKQQKNKQSEEEEKAEKQQIVQLEEAIGQLRHKLKDSTESFNTLDVTYQELQTEHEGLQARHHEFIEEIGEKELHWKQKLTQVKLEASTKVLEYQDKLQLMQTENEKIQMKSKELEDQQSLNSTREELSNEEKERYEEEIVKLQDEVHKLKKLRSDSKPGHLDLRKQESIDSRNDSVEYKSVSERQDGEGMDSRELEIIDTLSQRGSVPHTPTSPSHASILERLLSPIEPPILTSPQTPNAMREELSLAKTSLQTALKKNDHMTALIRESEANASRLADQAKVLKDEIRRLERNEEREQALSNMEYLKNVIIKFLKVGSVEKEQLIPVLSTMLKLSDEEKKYVFEYAKGEADDSEDNGSWSSYVYRWTSLS